MYCTILCYHPYLVSLLFADLQSLHLATFLMFFILVYVTFIFTEQQVHVWAEDCHLSQTSKSVLIIHSLPYAEFGFCNHEITQTNTGNYTWEETESNNVVLQGCALGPAQGIAVEDAVARRKCNMFGEWENPDTDNCITIVSRQFMDLQESITTVSILFLLLVLHSITVSTIS